MNTQAYYPRFIRVMPKFFGFDLTDLTLFVCGLFIGKLLINPLVGIGIAVAGIIINKTVLKSFDFKGFVLGRYQRQTLPWIGRMGGGK